MRVIIFNDLHRGFSEKTSKIHDRVFASIDQSLFDAIIVCGDWGTINVDQVKQCFKAFRKAFPTKKIMGVLGNHDFWDKKYSVHSIQLLIYTHAKKYDIHLLEKNPFIHDDVVFMGFNGWYFGKDPGNDPEATPQFKGEVPQYRIRPYSGGVTTDKFMNQKADEAVDFILNQDVSGKKVVIVTHFPCVKEAIRIPEFCGNPIYGEKLLPIADYMFFGHTHEELDIIVGKTRLINVGSGYSKNDNGATVENLLYKIVEI